MSGIVGTAMLACLFGGAAILPRTVRPLPLPRDGFEGVTLRHQPCPCLPHPCADTSRSAGLCRSRCVFFAFATLLLSRLPRAGLPPPLPPALPCPAIAPVIMHPLSSPPLLALQEPLVYQPADRLFCVFAEYQPLREDPLDGLLVS